MNFGGLRIGGWSGIFKQVDYLHTHYEVPPFRGGEQVSAYHVRSIEKFRLGLLATKEENCLDLFMTHDWPVGITNYGDKERLLRFKPYFKDDIEKGQLGNPFSEILLPEIRPRYWFSAHLHAKFEATVNHEAGSQTKFLALHKCNRTKMNKMFFDVKEIEVDSPLSNELRYDPTWLAILRLTICLEDSVRSLAQIPENASDFLPNENDLKEIYDLFEGNYIVPLNFQRTAIPQYAYKQEKDFFGAHYFRNPQSKEFCEKITIPDINEQLCLKNMNIVGDPFYLSEHDEKDAGEIPLNDNDVFEDLDFIEDTTPLPEVPTKKRHADDSSLAEKRMHM